LPQFRGVVAKKGTPPDRVKVLADAFQKAMQTPEWKKFAEEWYFRPDSYQNTADFTKWVGGEVTTLERLVKEFGLRQ
jgi:tripartite-type tricarboxylate transporter receptor subunit TctC